MQIFAVGIALAGSLATALLLQRALLEAWLRAIEARRVAGTVEPDHHIEHRDS